jgi:hypothetical protein
LISNQQNNYTKKERKMKNEEIYNKLTEFITEYQEYFLDNEIQWINTLEGVKKYINENNKRPLNKH